MKVGKFSKIITNFELSWKKIKVVIFDYKFIVFKMKRM